MKITELEEKYKMYDVKTSNKDIFLVNGEQLQEIIDSDSSFFRLPNGEGFNKSFLINWTINIDATRDNVQKLKPKILEDGENTPVNETFTESYPKMKKPLVKKLSMKTYVKYDR